MGWGAAPWALPSPGVSFPLQMGCLKGRDLPGGYGRRGCHCSPHEWFNTQHSEPTVSERFLLFQGVLGSHGCSMAVRRGADSIHGLVLGWRLLCSALLMPHSLRARRCLCWPSPPCSSLLLAALCFLFCPQASDGDCHSASLVLNLTPLLCSVNCNCRGGCDVRGLLLHWNCMRRGN